MKKLFLMTFILLTSAASIAQAQSASCTTGERGRVIIYATGGEFTKLDSLAFLRGIDLTVYQNEADFVAALREPDVVGTIYGGSPGSDDMTLDSEDGTTESVNPFAALHEFRLSGGRLLMLYSADWAQENDLLQRLFRVSVPREDSINQQDFAFTYADGLLPYWLKGLAVTVNASGVDLAFSGYLVTPEDQGDKGFYTAENGSTPLLMSFTQGDIAFFPVTVDVREDTRHYFFDDRYIDNADNEQAAMTMLRFAEYCRPPWTRAQPDQIAFVSDRDVDQEIYLSDIDGGGLRNLTENFANDRDPSWSPDGQRLAFVSDRDGFDEIYILDLETDELMQLTDDEFDVRDLTWSPTGEFMAFVSERGQDAEIYVIAANGSEVRQLTDNDYDDIHPTWSPDGTHIAFSTNRPDPPDPIVLPDGTLATPTPPVPDTFGNIFITPAGDYELYSMNINGQSVNQITDNDAMDIAPNWSPDGSGILFISDMQADRAAYIIGVGGGAARRLFAESFVERLAWSPDGTRVAFGSSPIVGFEANIYIRSLTDTEGGAQLTETIANDWNPAWYPLGTYIPQDPTRPDHITDDHIRMVQAVQNQLVYDDASADEARTRLQAITVATGQDGLTWIVRNIPFFDPSRHDWFILNDMLREMIGDTGLVLDTARVVQDPVGMVIDLSRGSFSDEDLLDWMGLRG